MKKLLSYLFLLFAVISLAACQGVVFVESLQVSGEKTEFVLGDEFSTGEMTVIAVYTNGNEEDVTTKAKVTPSTDMSEAGTFTVKVYFEGAEAEYSIRVEAPQLVSVDFRHEAAKKNYVVGEELSTEFVEAIAHYTNSITGDSSETVAFEASVVNASGEEVEGAFEYTGEYTVTIAFGEHSDSYKVQVSNEYASVEQAIAAGVANAGKVASGVYSNEYEQVTYEFGKNYYTQNDGYEVSHYSMNENEEIVGVGESYGSYSSLWAEVDSMKGVNRWILNYEYNAFGPEQLVETAYSYGKEVGYAFKETAEEGSYSFSYNYTYVSPWDPEFKSYFGVSVEFKLGKGAEISEVHYSEYSYDVEQIVIAEDGSWVVAEGVEAEPNTTHEYVQVIGERTAEYPFPTEKVIYQSFDVVDAEGNEAPAEYTVEAGTSVVVYIANPAPATAIPDLNEIECTCEDPELYIMPWMYGNEITLTPNQPGTYVLTITVGAVEFNVTIVATEPQPEEVVTYTYEETMDYYLQQKFYEMVQSSETTVAMNQRTFVGGEVYPELASQDVTIALKEAYETAELSEVTEDEAWGFGYMFVGEAMAFEASAVGTYVVVISCAANPEISAEVVVTVVEAIEEEPVEATFVGSWVAMHPMTGMMLAEMEVYYDAVSISVNGEYAMFGWSEEAGVITFIVPEEYEGAIQLSAGIVVGEYESVVVTVTYMGRPMELTFQK